jgi:ubiquinone/menaquinone biosynthesis C-methylase UbiE
LSGYHLVATGSPLTGQVLGFGEIEVDGERSSTRGIREADSAMEMTPSQSMAASGSGFWDSLAPHHALIEDNYLDLASIRRMLPELVQAVLVVGAGQGLIVEELRKQGLQCEGVDYSPEMVRYARIRRGLLLIQADARATPFNDGTYRTVIYATGVIDFMADEQGIRSIIHEGRRIVNPSGKIFVAFYRLSRAQEEFLTRLGLLRQNVLSNRECLELYLLNPVQMLGWVAKKAHVGYCRAAALVLRMAASSSLKEKITTFQMQKIFRKMGLPQSLIGAAQEQIPYRNEPEIQNLFKRLEIPIEQFRTLRSCFIVEI